ncbi:nucleolar and coiled-body phosphoprotein 1-like [Pectinophora gossypiella]|uniref:nucleolar and coiled-body phosphoprotein 1-like n=1 Tax=Pectinophora gossypiella TaxID=13191 RepID=UPI00214EB97C|nr:nucleolar and coiled-body phosphoprotein 1-like [Pectinophora gossypiella]
MLQKQRSTSLEKERADDQCYVKNSSFLSRDIEAQKVKEIASKIGKESPPKTASPPRKAASPPKKEASPPKGASPPKEVTSPPAAVSSFRLKRADSKADENSVVARASKIEAACSPPNKEVTSPPVSAAKITRTNSKENSCPPKVPKRENSLNKEPPKVEKLPLVSEKEVGLDSNKNTVDNNSKVETPASSKEEESNGVGDKIKKFEKAAEDATGTVGRLSRPGSVRGRARACEAREDFPPPATPFKDNVHFDLGPADKPETNFTERQGIMKNNTVTPKWQRSESHEERVIQKPEPQKIIKPEFKPMPSPVDVTIRSPSLGAKVPDQFPSHGTAFRNVASPDQARTVKFNEEVNTHNNLKPCKLKTKEKYSVSKGSSYFTRGSEEIWLVKKKDIEEIEERVLDSFRRAGGNICMRSESMRPASDGGQGASFSHATMGRSKRPAYARSESLDPAGAAARAHTLKRQTSVACTCGHDKKPRARSAGQDAPRMRSRSHGDDQPAVLDKYETLV